MTLDLAAALLNRASNGDELLSILDGIASEGNAHERQFQTASEGNAHERQFQTAS